MRVVFAGTPEPALPALDAIAASPHELVGVITRPDAPAGRGRRLTSSPVAARAEELGVAVLKPDHPRDPKFQEALRDLAPDCCPVVAYGALLPQSALDIPAHGWVNLHFSVLPAWRGAAPVQHALWAGDEVTGATTFRIVRELDAGPTYGLMTERVRPGDTAGSLLARLAEGGAGLLVATLDGSRTARSRPASSPRTASASPPRSPSRTRRSTGPSRRWAWTAGFAPARPCPAPGRRTRASGSSSARSRRPMAGSPLASCSSARTRSPSAPERARSSSAGPGVRQEGDAGRRLGPRRLRIQPGARSY